MGEIIEFPNNGGRAKGYIAAPSAGPQSGPGILVLQEWWGLIDQITRTCDRLAEEGFVALAPDLFDGNTVPLSEPDEAAKQMMAIKMADAAKALSGAVDELRRRTGRDTIGAIGFCMGGGLALVLGTQRPDAVAAVVAAYGVIPWPDAQPDYSKMGAAVQLHAAEQDDFFPPDAARALETQLKELGTRVERHDYAGVGHAFFNEDRPEVYNDDAATTLWERSLSFLRDNVR